MQSSCSDDQFMSSSDGSTLNAAEMITIGLWISNNIQYLASLDTREHSSHYHYTATFVHFCGRANMCGNFTKWVKEVDVDTSIFDFVTIVLCRFWHVPREQNIASESWVYSNSGGHSLRAPSVSVLTADWNAFEFCFEARCCMLVSND